MTTTLHHHQTDPQHPDQHDRHGDHDRHDRHDHLDHAEQFRRLFWWSLALAVPVIVFSEMVQEWFGYTIDLPEHEPSRRCSASSCSSRAGDRSSRVGWPNCAPAGRG